MQPWWALETILEDIKKTYHHHHQTFEWYLYILKGLFPKNENYVINYSPSCPSKPVRPSFIFRTQIKIFLMKSKSFLTLHRQQWNFHVQGPKVSKDIIKMVHVTLVVQP